MNKSSKSDMKRLISYIFGHNKGKMTLVIVCLFFAAVASSASGVFVFLIIEKVIVPALANGFSSVSSVLTQLLAAMLVVYGAGVTASLIYSRIMAEVGQKTLNCLRKDMFAKMETLPVSYFDRRRHGDIMSHFTNDIDAIRQFISQSMVQIINTAFTLVMLTVAMLLISVWLTLAVYICAAAMLLVVGKVGGKAAKSFVAQQKSTAGLEGFVEEIMNGEKVVKVFTHERETTADFSRLNDEVKEASGRANEYGNIIMPTLSGIGNYMYVLLAIVGSVILLVPDASNLTLTGLSAMSAAVVVSFLSMSRQFGQSIAQVSQQTSMCAMAFAGAGRVFALIDEEPEVDDGVVKLVNVRRSDEGALEESPEKTGLWAWKSPLEDGGAKLTELKGNIIFDGVDFGYDESHAVLKNINLTAKAGEKIAFVGATGAGKTTITNLINRFYEVSAGKILYDGIDVKAIAKADLRKSLAVVLQDTSLFSGTVSENIRYGRLDATDSDVCDAAKTADAYDFVMKLPEAFDTTLSADGANLSQGQRQLISIARAAVADTPVLILDEATSSIDTRTEKLVQRGTEKLMEGRTVFVIAHRLSTVRSSDKIVVLEQGKIIEQGSHDELLAQKGQYFQLYTGAFELD